jgi:hypothetical protein
MLKTLLLFGLVFIVFYATSQAQISKREIDSAFCVTKIDSLQKVTGFNKEITPQYKLPALIALSYFPELDSTRIIFKHKKIKTTLNSRPTLWSMIFRKRANRKFIIRINNRKQDSLVLFGTVPFNAKIGLLGHEFSHIIDYQNKSISGVFKRGCSYRNNKKKELFEKEIDSITVSRGLGWQLYDWSVYVLEKSNAKQEYKTFKKDIYLEPDEIKKLME